MKKLLRIWEEKIAKETTIFIGAKLKHRSDYEM